MSMFQITGQVINVFKQDPQVDKETGELGKAVPKVQILGDLPIQGEGSRMDLVTLSIPENLDFAGLINKKVSLPLGIFAPAKGVIVYFIPKGSSVQILDA